MTKHIYVFCLDVSPSMSVSDSHSSFLNNSIKGITTLLQQKVFEEKKDLVGLVLFGTKNTKNPLADMCNHEQYKHILVARDPAICDLAFIKYVQEDIKPGTHQGDFLDAIVVAMDLIASATNGKKFTKHISLFTNGQSPFNPDKTDAIIECLKAEEYDLTVIGDFDEPEIGAYSDSSDGILHLGSQSDIVVSSMTIPPPSSSSATASTITTTSSSSSSTKLKTIMQKRSERFLRNLVKECDGDIHSIREALQLMSRLRTKEIRQTTTFRGDLEIGSLKIRVFNYTRTAEFKIPTFKKLSGVAQQAAVPGTMEVKRETTYWIENDEEESEVPKEELEKAYRYGKSYVPWLKIDEESLKLKCHKCLTVLGFTRSIHVPRHHYMNGAVAVLPQPGDPIAARALSAFGRAMFERDSVAIVCYTFRENANPRLGVLTPRIGANHEYLVYSSLPFAEDVRSYTFTSLNQRRFTPTQHQLDAVDSLIDSLDLMNGPPATVYDKAREALHPKLSFNPVIRKLYQSVLERALNPENPLPKLDPIVESYVKADKAMFAAAQHEIDNIKQLFPLIDSMKKKKMATDGNGGTRWSNAAIPLLAAGNSDENVMSTSTNATSAQKRHAGDNEVTNSLLVAGAKKVKSEPVDSNSIDVAAAESIKGGGGGISLASIAKAETKEVGSIDPVGDFLAMVGSKSVDLVSEAISQMQSRVVEFVNQSFGNSTYFKALDCVKVLREVCASMDESNEFNGFLKSMKQILIGSRREDFWKLIVSNRVSLISSEESYDSTTTPEEADEFLDLSRQVSQAAPVSIPKSANGDVDDIMDMLD